MSLHKFATIADAEAAGYVRATSRNSRDVSPEPWFGYDWQDADGNRSVDVLITSERNHVGNMGCICHMFPPRNG